MQAVQSQDVNRGFRLRRGIVNGIFFVLTVILALTVLSGLTVTIPVPVAVVVTAGDSLAPESVMFWPCAIATLASNPNPDAAANAMTFLVQRMIPPLAIYECAAHPAEPGVGSKTIAPRRVD